MRKVILSSILIRIFISMVKHPDHKQVGKKVQHQRKSFFLVEPRTTSSAVALPMMD